MSPVKYCVPRDTASALGSAYPLDCDNFGLLLARYLPHDVIGVVEPDRNGRLSVRKDRDWLLHELDHFVARDQNDLEILIAAFFDRWGAMLSSSPFEFFEMRCAGRLVIGLGGESPLETDLRLHHITGLPIIPGSALKGLCRNYALLSIAESSVPRVGVNSKDLDELDDHLMLGKVEHPDAESYRLIFGSQEQAGGCVFYDAVVTRSPAKKSLFVMDVMTPHFARYYTSKGKKEDHAPNDADKPNPIPFIAVRESTRFGFGIGLRSSHLSEKLLDKASKWLRAGLQEMGVGAKTAAGYGVFAPPPKQG